MRRQPWLTMLMRIVVVACEVTTLRSGVAGPKAEAVAKRARKMAANFNIFCVEKRRQDICSNMVQKSYQSRKIKGDHN